MDLEKLKLERIAAVAGDTVPEDETGPLLVQTVSGALILLAGPRYFRIPEPTAHEISPADFRWRDHFGRSELVVGQALRISVDEGRQYTTSPVTAISKVISGLPGDTDGQYGDRDGFLDDLELGPITLDADGALPDAERHGAIILTTYSGNTKVIIDFESRYFMRVPGLGRNCFQHDREWQAYFGGIPGLKLGAVARLWIFSGGHPHSFPYTTSLVSKIQRVVTPRPEPDSDRA